jgi:hypothetical protein
MEDNAGPGTLVGSSKSDGSHIVVSRTVDHTNDARDFSGRTEHVHLRVECGPSRRLYALSRKARAVRQPRRGDACTGCLVEVFIASDGSQTLVAAELVISLGSSPQEPVPSRHVREMRRRSRSKD